MKEKLEKFVEMEFDYCCKATTTRDKTLYFHNAFGAVQWESYRTGKDLKDWWHPWREKFLIEIWGE